MSAQNNLFQIFPPTPRQAMPAVPYSNNITSGTITANPDPNAPQLLHPAPSFASWRTHRASSSASSRSSSVSNMDGWSTVDQGASDTSDSDGLGAALDMMDFDTSFGLHSMGLVPQQGLKSDTSINPEMLQRRSVRNVSKPVTLSIDPNLFRPKSHAQPSVATARAIATARTAKAYVFPPQAGASSEDEGEEVVAITTAVLKKKGSGAGRGSKAGGKVKKASHARKQKTDHIPRPRNAFILFRKHVVDSKLIPASVEMRHQNVSVIVAKMWADAPADQKERFNDLAKVEKEEHMKMYPGYRYQPVYRRTNVIRRRVRKDEAEEEKCNKVAALLLNGKSGEQLEEEIKAKMQHSSGKRNKSRKSSGANELSKGALRALKAQAREKSTTASTSGRSRSQSRSQTASSYTDSVDSESQYDSRRGSVVSDLEMPVGLDYAALGLQPNVFMPQPQDHAHWGYGTQGGLPAYQHQLPGQTQVWAPNQPVMQQTWAYPDHATGQQGMMMPQMQMQQFAYQQPSHVDPYFNYDHALPFSPTAHAFDQSFPIASIDVLGYAPGETVGAYDTTFSGCQAMATIQQPLNGMMIPSQTAKLDATFRPGEGLALDDTGLLGEFGAGYMPVGDITMW